MLVPRAICCCAVLLVVLALQADDHDAPPLVSPEREAQFQQTIVPFVTQYCADCHTGDEAKKGLKLSDFHSAESLAHDRKTWKKVVEKLRAREMPPKDASQPKPEQTDAVLHLVVETLAEAARNAPHDPGRVTMRRLNRAEYNNTLRDLFGVDFRPGDDFPNDDVGHGFDNNGDVLSLPPLLLEKYLTSAEKVLRLVLTIDDGKSHAPRRFNADQLEGFGFGHELGAPARMFTRAGEIVLPYDFTRDADYEVRIHAWSKPLEGETVQLALKLDGAIVKTFDVAPDANQSPYVHKLRVEAGKHKLAAAFLNPTPVRPEIDPQKAAASQLSIDFLEIDGPLLHGDEQLPEAYHRLMIADPAQLGRAEAARQILRRFADRAFRRPVDNDELDRLLTLFAANDRTDQPFAQSLQPCLAAILVNPNFLFRVEADPQPTNPHTQRRLNDWELASRLSYFLWSSMPDQELFDLAARNQLHDQLETQVRRMLHDPKSQALVENFAGQWLQTRRLETVSPDLKQFPQWNPALRQAMRQEAASVFAYVISDDRSLLEFIDAPYTFLNQSLAEFYGIDGVAGNEFRRVDLPAGSPRGGVITMAAVLTVTSNPDRTSPVKRGKWLLDNILGTPPPPPLPNVPQLVVREQNHLIGSVRHQTEQHRKDPACASCHARIDPLGFGLENFDAIGAWRVQEGGALDRNPGPIVPDPEQVQAIRDLKSRKADKKTVQAARDKIFKAPPPLPPIDATGTLPDGRTFNGPVELKKILLAQRDLFCRAISEKMLIYALGRGATDADEPAIDSIAAAVAQNDYKFSRLVLEIVRSEPFLMRRGDTIP